MKFTISPLTLAFIAPSLLQLAQATAFLSSCSVTAEDNGNRFDISVTSVPAISSSSICGQWNSDLITSANSAGIQIPESLACNTDSSAATLEGTVTLNKQSPTVQAEALLGALNEAFGSQGFDENNGCDVSGIPTKKFKGRGF
ncbi:hypothetical protein BDZ45DRAFT_732920 [Acephala macrosclerotiorum]|nr:hypothetical protein BDZ45DRAFT_732920 [Acephala macrosclerotiorum]